MRCDSAPPGYIWLMARAAVGGFVATHLRLDPKRRWGRRSA